MKGVHKTILVIILVCVFVLFIFFSANRSNKENSSADFCPEGMAYVAGGMTTVVYMGKRWGGKSTVQKWVDPFCVDKYEASQPDATDIYRGSWQFGPGMPEAKSRPGVIPWTAIGWDDARSACEKSGKRLPTLAEWQTAFSGLEGNDWPWGNEWKENDCYLEIKSNAYPTGACCFATCSLPECGEVCDFVGNVSEWIGDYWDSKCYGKKQAMVAGGSAHQYRYAENEQEADPDNPGCWRFTDYSAMRYGLHHHPLVDGFEDDGFRCVLSVEQ